MNYTYSFEKLDVWQLSRKLVTDIYMVTKGFPKEEQFGITSQIRRAAISVSSNIAEGSSRTGIKDQSQFSVIAYSSLMELLCQLILSFDLNFISSAQYSDIRSKIEEISNKLNALRNYQQNRKQSAQQINN
jgi:four helix bundle protein